MYTPGAPPVGDSLEEVVRYLQEELFRVQTALDVVADGRALSVLTVAPSKAATGQLAYADGTSWNPGGGEGYYQRTSAGAWVKL